MLGGRALTLMVLLAAMAGCSATNSAYCDAETPCSDPEVPYCNVERNQCSATPEGELCSPSGECADPDKPVCLEGVCVGCASDDDCPVDSPACETATLTCGACGGEGADEVCSRHEDAPYCVSGGCGECRDAGDCTTDQPVCDDDSATCRGCEADTECDSLLCNEDVGTCVNDLEVLYVSVDGTDEGSCRLAQPCKTLARAVEVATENRSLIHLSNGTYTEAVTIEKNLTLIGADATLAPATSDAAIIAVAGGAHVIVEALDLQGAGGQTLGAVECAGSSLTLRGVRVSDNGFVGVRGNACYVDIADSEIAGNANSNIAMAAGTLMVRDTVSKGSQKSGLRLTEGAVAELLRFEATGNAERGVYSTASEVVLKQSVIADNEWHGVYASTSPGTVRIERSIISGNGGSGVTVGSHEVMMFNNFIVDNGHGWQDTAHGGGIRLVSVEDTSRVEHNTIVGNDSTMADYPAGGISCEESLALALKNNIVASNTGEEVSGGCSHATSLVNGEDPKFVGGGDYHVTSDSPAVAEASTSEGVTEDFDGQARPAGGPEIGADEYYEAE